MIYLFSFIALTVIRLSCASDILLNMNDELACFTKLIYINNNKHNWQSQSYLAASSQGLNNLGDYDRCQNVTNSQIISAYLDNTFDNLVPVPYVLCFPQECTGAFVSKHRIMFDVIINDAISIFPNAPIVKITSVYSVFEDAPSPTVGSVLVYLLLGALIIITITASVITHFNTQKLENSLKQSISSQDKDDLSAADSFCEKKMENQTNLIKISKAMSILNNFLKLFSLKSKGHLNFSFLNGTLFLSIAWVILGNSYLIRYSSIKNTMERETIQTDPGYTTIVTSSQLAIDIFFYISGFLFTSIILERFKNRKVITLIDILTFAIHRFLRLWPTYIFTVLIYWQIMKFTGQAPMWNQFTDQISTCDSSIWKNILLIDNLAVNGSQQGCFSWGWVVSTDFQFFFIALFLLYVYFRSRKIGLSLLFVVFVASSASSFFISMNKDYKYGYFTLTDPVSFYNDFFIKPWYRINTYVMGSFVGILYMSYRNGEEKAVEFAKKVKKDFIIRWTLYLVGLGLMNAMVWCVIPVQKDSSNWSQVGHSLYLAFGKVLFTLGFVLLTLPSLFGRRNALRSMLGARFWIPLSKLAFGMYLCHQFIIERSQFNQKELRYFDSQYAFYMGFTDIVISLIVATLITLLVEIPISNLEKIYLIPLSTLQGQKTPQLDEDDDDRSLMTNEKLLII